MLAAVALTVLLSAPSAWAVVDGVFIPGEQLSLPADWTYNFQGGPGNNVSPDQISAKLAETYGAAAIQDLLLKHEATPVDYSGPLGSAYTITYVGRTVDGKTVMDALIEWNGGAFAAPTFVIAKDGSVGTGVFDDKGKETTVIPVYGWDVRGKWDGKEDLLIQNPFGGKDFSFEMIYGTAVPEPSTILAGALLLVPFGVGAIRAVRRNRKA